MLGWAALMAGGCSLRSLDELKRCTGKGESVECPSPGTSGAGAQAGGGMAGNAASGGSGAAGGSESGGTAPAEGGAGGAASVEPELIVRYAYREPEEDETLTESKAIRPIFVIQNESEVPVDISTLKIRYYYTLENPSAQESFCDFVDPEVVSDCDGVVVTFGSLDRQAAKNYAEVTFSPPDDSLWLIPELGGSSGEIRLRFRKADFSIQKQLGDYSFDESKLEEPEPWDHVTLYRNGVLVWGVEPS
jgi:endoglucanase